MVSEYANLNFKAKKNEYIKQRRLAFNDNNR